MTDERRIVDLKPGAAITYHGGWNPDGEKCETCDFCCGYTYHGVIVGQYEVWNRRSERFYPDPTLWEAQLSNGSYVVGYAEQFR
jgi:hypothetical protein